MAYIKNTWDKYTWAKGQVNLQNQLTKMEEGIANAGQGGGGAGLISISVDQLTKAGVSTDGIPYFTIELKETQQEIIENENVALINVDISDISAAIEKPIKNVFIHKNSIQNYLDTYDIIQFAFDYSAVDVENVLTDFYLTLKNTGTGNAYYNKTAVEGKKYLFISFNSINIVDTVRKALRGEVVAESLTNEIMRDSKNVRHSIYMDNTLKNIIVYAAINDNDGGTKTDAQIKEYIKTFTTKENAFSINAYIAGVVYDRVYFDSTDSKFKFIKPNEVEATYDELVTNFSSKDFVLPRYATESYVSEHGGSCPVIKLLDSEIEMFGTDGVILAPNAAHLASLVDTNASVFKLDLTAIADPEITELFPVKIAWMYRTYDDYYFEKHCYVYEVSMVSVEPDSVQSRDCGKIVALLYLEGTEEYKNKIHVYFNTYGYLNLVSGEGGTSINQIPYDEEFTIQCTASSKTGTIVHNGASGNNSAAFNTLSAAKGLCSAAFGDRSVAWGQSSFAAGAHNVAEGKNSTVFGINNSAEGESSFAVGTGNKAAGSYSFAEGNDNIADGANSHAEGYRTHAQGSQSHTEGYYTKAFNAHETAVGKCNVSNTEQLFSVGNGSSPENRHNAFEVYENGDVRVGVMGTNDLSVATKQYVDEHGGGGSGAVTIKIQDDELYFNPETYEYRIEPNASHLASLKNESNSIYKFDFTELSPTYQALLPITVAWTYRTYDDNYWGKHCYLFEASSSHIAEPAEVKKASKIVLALFLEGDESYLNKIRIYTCELRPMPFGKGTGTGSLAQDNLTDDFGEKITTFNIGDNPYKPEFMTDVQTIEAAGNYSLIFNGSNRTNDSYSLAFGMDNVAHAFGSVAQGNNTIAMGDNSHAEGRKTATKGDSSHAEGAFTLAQGTGSHAEGSWTKALGDFSHTSGNNTVASIDYQTVIGQWNTNKADTLFEVGCGTSDTARKNAFEVYQDGSVGLGYLTVAPTSDNTSGLLKIVVLQSEPTTRYKGYLYFIVE